MEGLSRARWTHPLRRPLARAAWHVRRLGPFGWSVLACAGLTLGALLLAHQQALSAGALEARLAQRGAERGAGAPRRAASFDQAGARARLDSFDRLLLPHGEIPAMVQQMIELGAAEGLIMQRGSYRAQSDSAGRFLRYRMTLPVKGSGKAIQRFMKTALREQRSLALESVQFRRAAVGASEVEARIQWIVLSALPQADGAHADLPEEAP
ncbi:hypothetical protein [Massilia sp. CCM 8734]|uniref:hypothetical protein n=1 Tax=Massilia sp. CCM 8734 TaxID=2609283 RepID=UPI00141E2F01|nr:hypothetical protein [Massilia sp. CCM 8734]NHZ99841.1 hypothetical protein [Massilia sp. CCM 8734]